MDRPRRQRRHRHRGTWLRIPAFVVISALGIAVAAQETFYDAYELGLAHARAGRWQQALDAFEIARDLRPEAGRDVPTFGRDSIAVYDPSYQLARVRVELGQLEAAAADLDDARRSGVTDPAAFDALAGRIGGSGPAAHIGVGQTAPPPATTARADTVSEIAARPTATPETETASESTAVPDPSPVPATPDAELGDPAADPEKARGGGGLVLVVLAAVAVAVVLLRRRRRRSADQPPSYETTPTQRVETEAGRAAPTTAGDGGTNERVLGGYRLGDRLGRGGMATTYRARRIADDTAAVVKIPHEHLLDDVEFVERFLREGALGATIHHPNIIRIFEAGRDGDTPFIAMELVDGETLEAVLARRGALPVDEALEIVRGIALALDYAHVKGVVHRDVKPDNVMLSDDGGVKVMDFGIARVASSPGLTATDTYLGTPLYSAPEAVDPREVGPQSDLYSLGIVLYRMLTNRAPFEAPSPLRVVELHRTEPLPPLPTGLGVPPRVEVLLRRLTAKRKAERTPSAEVLLQELNLIRGTPASGPLDPVE